MSIPEYLSRAVFPKDDQVAYQYKYGDPLVRSEQIPHLSTRMRKLHRWYMEACKEGTNWVIMGLKEDHYGHGDDEINIEFNELFQLYNQDAIDKSVVSAYCL
jgi:hypothetical protein